MFHLFEITSMSVDHTIVVTLESQKCTQKNSRFENKILKRLFKFATKILFCYSNYGTHI